MEQNISVLKKTLERIEKKLISTEKIYSAMQFQMWLVVMLLYYIILALFHSIPWQLTALYWLSAFVVFLYASMKIWKRIVNLFKSYGRYMEMKPSFGLGMSLSWIFGAVMGWIVIPATLLQMGVEEISAIALLSFISISVFGMFLTFMYFAKSIEKEMIPAFLFPALAIASLGIVTIESMVYAGFAVGFGYSLTVLAYLYTAFKALR